MEHHGSRATDQKKRYLCTTKDEETKSFLDEARERAKDSLDISCTKTNMDIMDLSYLLQSVRALIDLNLTIWERCCEQQSGTLEHAGRFSFSRVTFSKIKTRSNKAYTHFQFETKVESKDFGTPPGLPQALANLMGLPMNTSRSLHGDLPAPPRISFPDYSAYLDRLTLLRDDVMLTCLLNFKHHLEEIHVFLGEIDGWIMESTRQADFLEDIFDGISDIPIPSLEEMIIPCSKNGGDSKCCKIPHPNDSRCLRCHKPFGDHPRGLTRAGAVSHICDYHTRNVGSFLTTRSGKIEMLYCHPTTLHQNDGETTVKS